MVTGSLGTLKKGIQLALGPDLENIKKDLSDLKGEVRVIGVKQDAMKTELKAEIRAVDSKVEQLDKKLDMDRRMTIMEAKMKELEKRR